MEPTRARLLTAVRSRFGGPNDLEPSTTVFARPTAPVATEPLDTWVNEGGAVGEAAR
jgi:hypothetical protein